MRLTFEPHECTSFIEKKGKSTVLKQYKWQFFQVFTLHPFSSCFHFSLPSQGSITGKYISGHGKYKHTMCHIRPAAGDFATDELTKWQRVNLFYSVRTVHVERQSFSPPPVRSLLKRTLVHCARVTSQVRCHEYTNDRRGFQHYHSTPFIYYSANTSLYSTIWYYDDDWWSIEATSRDHLKVSSVPRDGYINCSNGMIFIYISVHSLVNTLTPSQTRTHIHNRYDILHLSTYTHCTVNSPLYR